MGLFAKLSGLLSLLPYLVAGVNTLHSGATGADKKSAVLQLAGMGLQVAEVVVPGAAPAIELAAPHIGKAIDAFVGIFNAFGIFAHKAAAPPAPAP
jgi:hypothetical protein